MNANATTPLFNPANFVVKGDIEKIPNNVRVAARRLGTNLASIKEVEKKILVWRKMCRKEGFELESTAGSAFIAAAIKLKQNNNLDCVYIARLMGKYLEAYYLYMENNMRKPDIDIDDFVIKQYELDQLVDPIFINDHSKAIEKACKGLRHYLKNRNKDYTEKGGLYGKDF